MNSLLFAVPSALSVGLLATFASPFSAGEEDAPPITQEELEALAAEVQGQVAELRGVPFKHAVKVELANKEQLIDYMNRRVAEHSSEAELEQEALVQKALGLLPPDVDILAIYREFLAAQVAGFYDPPTKSFYLMDGMPSSMAGIIMAHELTHALDDQYFEIDKPMDELRGAADAQLAYQALVEGSGMQTMAEWQVGYGDMSAMMDMLSMQEEQMAALTKTPRAIWLPSLAAYTQGQRFLAAGGQGGLERAFQNPPMSSEQVLHPEKYWGAGTRDDPRTVGIDLGTLRSGWTVFHEGTLGEMTLALVTSAPESGEPTGAELAMALQGPFSNVVASGWGGDKFVLLRKGDQLVFVSVSVWDSAVDAGEFRGALSVLGAGLGENARQLAESIAADESPRGGFKMLDSSADDEVRFLISIGISPSKAARLLRKIQVSSAEVSRTRASGASGAAADRR